MEKIVPKKNYRITHLSSFYYSQFRNFEMTDVQHFVVPNFDPPPQKIPRYYLYYNNINIFQKNA